MKLSRSQIRKVLKLRKDGYKIWRVAKEMKMTEYMVRTIVQRYGRVTISLSEPFHKLRCDEPLPNQPDARD